MNLLIFVSVLLTVLASMSYGALKLYMMQTYAQSAWTGYMEAYEGCIYNDKIKEVFKHVPKKKGEAFPRLDSTGKKLEDAEDSSDSSKKNNRSDGTAWINFRILTANAQMDPLAYELFEKLIKTIIAQNYAGKDFYEKALAERPNILDELIAFLKTLQDKKVSNAKALANVKIEDPGIKDLFYNLIRSTPVDGKDPCKEISLFDFLTDSRRTKISVYLAPKPILLALFGRSDLVDQIIEDREALYKEVKKEKSSEEATAEFQGKYEGQTDFREIVTFKVNKTNPKNY